MSHLVDVNGALNIGTVSQTALVVGRAASTTTINGSSITMGGSNTANRVLVTSTAGAIDDIAGAALFLDFTPDIGATAALTIRDNVGVAPANLLILDGDATLRPQGNIVRSAGTFQIDSTTNDIQLRPAGVAQLGLIAGGNIIMNGSANGGAISTVVRTHEKGIPFVATSVLRFTVPNQTNFAGVHVRMITRGTGDTNGVISEAMIGIIRTAGGLTSTQLGAVTSVDMGAGLIGYALSLTTPTPADAAQTQTFDFQVTTTNGTTALVFVEMKNSNNAGGGITVATA